MTPFTAEQSAFIQAQRVGRLATTDALGQPHVVPVCYAHAEQSFYIALDAKPKRVAPEQLKRVRNIRANPLAALVIDHYSEDWRSLAYLLVQGESVLLPVGDAEQQHAVTLLRIRYPQYHEMPIQEHPVIALRAASVVAWGAIQA